MTDHLQEAFAKLVGMAPRNSPTNARSQHSPKASSMDISSQGNTPPRRPATPTKEYGMVERPSPASPTMDVHAITKLPWGRDSAQKWEKAADLTTDYEDIDTKTLTSTLIEPRPSNPPTEPRPLSEAEEMAKHRGVMREVAARADYWFQGVKHRSLKYGIVQELPEFVQWRQDVLQDIRHVMDHAGRDEHEVFDKSKISNFFKNVAINLLELEKSKRAEGGLVTMDAFLEILAEWLVDLNVNIEMQKFVMFGGLERMVVRRRMGKGSTKRVV